MLELKPGCLISHKFLAQRYLLKLVAGGLYMHTYLRNKPAMDAADYFRWTYGGFLFLVFTFGDQYGSADQPHECRCSLLRWLPPILASPEMSGVIKGLLIVQFFGIFFLPPLVFAYLADPAPLAFAGIRPRRKDHFCFWHCSL